MCHQILNNVFTLCSNQLVLVLCYTEIYRIAHFFSGSYIPIKCREILLEILLIIQGLTINQSDIQNSHCLQKHYAITVLKNWTKQPNTCDSSCYRNSRQGYSGNVNGKVSHPEQHKLSQLTHYADKNAFTPMY